MQISIFSGERGGRDEEHVDSVQRPPRGPSLVIWGLRRRFYDPCMPGPCVRLAIHPDNTSADEKYITLA